MKMGGNFRQILESGGTTVKGRGVDLWPSIQVGSISILTL